MVGGTLTTKNQLHSLSIRKFQNVKRRIQRQVVKLRNPPFSQYFNLDATIMWPVSKDEKQISTSCLKR